MENLVYSFDPRVGHSSHEEVRAETASRHLAPDRRVASWQREDGGRLNTTGRWPTSWPRLAP